MSEILPRIRQLQTLALETVRAHGGQGQISMKRIFEPDDFEGPWNFVDYAVLPAGTSIGPHRHGDDEELYLILEGRGQMQLDDEVFEVGPGHVIVNRRNGVHGLQNTGTEPLRILVVEVAIPSKEDQA